ncbi:MAG: ATP-binding protein [Thermodesulfobacteriota bacterium]
MKPANIHEDPAFQAMTLDILSNVLDRADKPGELGNYLAEEIRELTGARCVLFIQGQEPALGGRFRVIGMNPPRSLAWAESAAAHHFYDMIQPFPGAQLWCAKEPSKVSEFLRQKGYELSLTIPLQVGAFRMGMMLILGLPDERHVTSVLYLLNNLSTIVALVVRNSFLYEKQEQIIRERTLDLQKAYERLQLKLIERERAENIMRARLRLLEFANTHSMDEFLTATLDEIENMTGSMIGFYHFLESDQRTLTLQNWSSNTLKNMCTAEGKGSHYDIARAGVWVDCVHERRPVIHNDYASLTHRQGMPEGHAAVVRELVVPIFRGDLIKAIIGVGNKANDYDDGDIEVVSQLGDLSWDIAERKLMEEEIKNSREQYRTLIHSVPIGVISVDRNFLITEWNAMARSITGLTREDCLGKSYFEILEVLELKDCRLLSEVLKNQVLVGPIEYVLKNKSGASIPVRCLGAPFLDHMGQTAGGIKTIQDISEIKSLENERYLFMSMLAHDMKSPLVSIQGFAKRLLKKVSLSQTEQLNDYLEIISREAGKLEGLIKEFLEFSRLRSGQFSLDSSATNLKLVILQIIDTLSPRFSKEEIKIETQFGDDFPILELDSSRMRRVFINLIENALKHSPAKSTITISTLASSSDIIIKITDRGYGISPEDIPNIFEPFYRGLQAKPYHGYGLGLAAVSAIVKAHGGKVFASSQIGQGSCFTVALPRSLILKN